MAPNKFTSLFVTATALLLLAAAASAKDVDVNQQSGPVNPLCQDAVHKRMCNRMSRGGATPNDATVNALNSLKTLVKQVINMEPVLLSSLAKADAVVHKVVLETCQKELKKRLELLESSLKAFQAKDTKTVLANLITGTQDFCYTELQKNKKRGFDYTSPYFKKAGSILPEFNSVIEIVKKIK